MFIPTSLGHFNSISSSFSHSGFEFIEAGHSFQRKAAQLRCEGLGRIKIALNNMDTSLLEILVGHFGCMDMDISESTISNEKSEKKATIEEKTPNIPEKIQPHF